MLIRPWYGYVSKEPFDDSNGVNHAWTVLTQSVARAGTSEADDSPFLVANEWVCSSIGRFLRLPIPPFALLRQGGEKGLFASLNFGNESAPDDADPIECVKADPELCTGVLLFDSLIANSDRHVGNIKVDRPIQPTEMFIFDHDHALFGVMPGGDELKRFNALKDRLAITGQQPTGGNTHCFLKHIDSLEHFRTWLNRMESIPDWFIRQICQEMVGLGINQEQAEAASKFLIHRRDSLAEIVRMYSSEFEQIPKSDWGFWI